MPSEEVPVSDLLQLPQDQARERLIRMVRDAHTEGYLEMDRRMFSISMDARICLVHDGKILYERMWYCDMDPDQLMDTANIRAFLEMLDMLRKGDVYDEEIESYCKRLTEEDNQRELLDAESA